MDSRYNREINSRWKEWIAQKDKKKWYKMQDSESRLLPDSPRQSSVWALHSQTCLVFQGFPNSPETKNQVLLLPPISQGQWALPLSPAPALVIRKWSPSSAPADVKMQGSASDVCASGSLMGAPGRGEKMILEFQRSLLHRNNENCPHVGKKKKKKPSDVITGKSGNQTKNWPG